MDLLEIYLSLRPQDIAYVKFVFESYEGVGIIRTVLRQAQHSEPGRTIDRKKAIIVLLVASDFADVARRILASLKTEVPLTEIPRPGEIGDDWLMRELAAGSDPRRP